MVDACEGVFYKCQDGRDGTTLCHTYDIKLFVTKATLSRSAGEIRVGSNPTPDTFFQMFDKTCENVKILTINSSAMMKYNGLYL